MTCFLFQALRRECYCQNILCHQSCSWAPAPFPSPHKTSCEAEYTHHSVREKQKGTGTHSACEGTRQLLLQCEILVRPRLLTHQRMSSGAEDGSPGGVGVINFLGALVQELQSLFLSFYIGFKDLSLCSLWWCCRGLQPLSVVRLISTLLLATWLQED